MLYVTTRKKAPHLSLKSSGLDPDPDPNSGGLLDPDPDSESGSGSRGLTKDQKCKIIMT